ncbi:MAG: hypothetical protein M0P73_05965 [Syntrophobacterales bacterium]|jgi:hypothetical protein|nr:hypothetical protein [Syntrophobacterales bacterium]
MLIPCLRARAWFADPGLKLELRTPASLQWDEHGGTFVLKVVDLEVPESGAADAEPGLNLAMLLTPAEALSRGLKEFAARHELPLTPPSGPELAETALLAACHVPGKNLFIFAEAPALVATRRGGTVELMVTGNFQARRVPCRETDLIIHLSKAAMARLVAFVLSQVRGD